MGPGECKVELSSKEDAPLKRVDESYEPGLRCERRFGIGWTEIVTPFRKIEGDAFKIVMITDETSLKSFAKIMQVHFFENPDNFRCDP